MRRSALLSAFILCTVLSASAQHPTVQAILEAVRIDSIMDCLEKLTGEEPIDLGDGQQTITSRHQQQPGNVLAQRWLTAELERMGYAPVLDTFSITGINVLAWKTGTVHPEEAVIICAHYDSAPAGPVAAPGADDDASGCGAVWEAARLFRDVEFAYSVLFAFWDDEEQGLLGSKHFAQQAAINDMAIRGVVNMDAIAYDGNGDKKARIHTRPIANSFELSDTVFAVRAHYAIDLDLILTNPGATYSDHASFWNNGYGAILVIEEFGADGNPYYHTSNDRIVHFDLPYYEKLVKLSLATAATLAEPVGEVGVADVAARRTDRLNVYPNPTSGDARSWLVTSSGGTWTLELLDALGARVAHLFSGLLPPGDHRFDLPLTALPAGAYLLRATSPTAPPVTLRVVRTGG